MTICAENVNLLSFQNCGASLRINTNLDHLPVNLVNIHKGQITTRLYVHRVR